MVLACLRRLVLVAPLIALPVTACGGAPASKPDAADADAIEDAGVPIEGAEFVDCVNDPRADHYAAGMEKLGPAGKLRIKLVTSVPSPPTRGQNTWTIEVSDAAGMAQAGAKVKVAPFMPDHGHGPPVMPVVTPGATSGVYGVTPVYLYMAGLWQTTVDVVTAAGVSDSAVFSFCVNR